VREWWKNYVRDGAPFLGVRMADIRSETHLWYRHHVAGRVEPAEQFELAMALLRREHSEEKLAGTLLMQEILLPAGYINGDNHVERLAGLFSDVGIYDWNVCDWFCVKVLGPLIRQHGEGCAQRIGAWRAAADLWQARASLVAFVGEAHEPQYYALIFKGCTAVARREERFAKTAVGWILREISRHDVDWVRRSLDELLPHLTTESLRNATKYLDESDRESYMSRFKNRA
jgi:3-methyladenine DNA glycosylase AlkD